MKLLAELRRRNVIRMAGLYLVGAWLSVQVAALLPVFEAPAWVMKALVALLAIGFVAALVFSWVFELTPEGLKRDGDVPAAESIGPQTARRMDRMLLVGMALALGYNALIPLSLVRMGEIERGLELFARLPTSNDPLFLGEVLGSRLHPKAWASPAFPRFLREAGIAALWDQLGPPENCRKDAAGDYRCA